MPHIHEKIDFVSDVYIVFENKVLLRKHDKYKIWLAVGGHIELDEDPNQAAVREVLEEVGLHVTLHGDSYRLSENFQELIAPRFMNRHRINATHEHMSMVFFATSDTDELVLSENEKSDDCRWFTEEELESEELDLKDNIRMYALAALKELGKK